MDITHQNFLKKNFFENLDGIRAFSIIAVIWHHAVDHGQRFSFNFLNQGNHGVTLFFVLSGFLITTLLLREKKKNGNINLKAFYMRRTLRIFPLYYFVIICLYVPLVIFFENDPIRKSDFWNNLPYFLTYTGNLFAKMTTSSMIFLYSWSLAVEEQFYLIWPTIEKVFSSLVISIFILIIISIIYLNNLFSFIKVSEINFILNNISIPILMGVFAAHLLNKENSFRLITKVMGNQYAFLGSLIGLIISLELTRDTGIFIYLFSTLLVISTVFGNKFLGDSILQSKILVETGKVSYGIYLYHMISINISKKIFHFINVKNTYLTFVLSCLIAYGISYISFNYFEKYFINLKKRYSV